MPHKTYTLSLLNGCGFKVNAIIHLLPACYNYYELSPLTLGGGVLIKPKTMVFKKFSGKIFKI